MKANLTLMFLLCVISHVVVDFTASATVGPTDDSLLIETLHSVNDKMSDLRRRVEYLESGRTDRCTAKGWCVLFDFENGITGWTLTGKAFNNQPTYGDNPTARNRGQPSRHRGNWWVGGYERRPSPASPAGAIEGDAPLGTMTSPPFDIRGRKFRFLIGGGCNKKTVRAELVIGERVVAKATGKCHESMAVHIWNIGNSYIGQKGRVRLIDRSRIGWGHINFDHFEMHCTQ